MECDYGCGNKGQFEMTNGKLCCQPRYNKCPAVREKNKSGLRKAHAKGRMYKFSDSDRNKSNVRQIELAKKESFGPDVLQLTSTAKKYLKEMKDNKCEECGISMWQGHDLTLEIDHIDGNSYNNTLENLRLLCPNCHSLTNTYKGRNINNGKRKVRREKLISLYKEHGNIHRTLIAAGLAPKGANYAMMKKLIIENNLNQSGNESHL